MFLILFVLHDPEKMRDVLQAWEDAGVSGITILPSTGIGRLKAGEVLRDDLPLIPSLDDLMRVHETTNRTMLSIVRGEEMVERVVKATESVTGDLNTPNTGILTVIPVARTYGLDRHEE